MVKIDMNKEDPGLEPGVDLWRIIACTSGQSRAGDGMLKLKLARVSNLSNHMYDNIMLGGNGWGIGKAKLGVLLESGFSGDVDPLDFVGTELWTETVAEEYEYNGKSGKRLAVNINGLKHGGYQRREDVPPGKELPAAKAEEEDVPF